jgi:CTP-dependent riboflavin kinase
MSAPVTVTADELRLLQEPSLPAQILGLPFSGVVADGTGSAATWTDEFQRLFGASLNVTFHPGSLNLSLRARLDWPEPFLLPDGSQPWEFCPVVLEERAIGIAFRGNRERPDLMEIASPVLLRARLVVEAGSAVRGRLLPGRLLAFASA